MLKLQVCVGRKRQLVFNWKLGEVLKRWLINTCSFYPVITSVKTILIPAYKKINREKQLKENNFPVVKITSPVTQKKVISQTLSQLSETVMQAADSLLLAPVEISNIIDIVCATWQPGLGGNTNKQSVCWELLWFFGLVFLRAFFSPPFSLITFIASPSFHACKYLHLGRVVFCAACISQ